MYADNFLFPSFKANGIQTASDFVLSLHFESMAKQHIPAKFKKKRAFFAHNCLQFVRTKKEKTAFGQAQAAKAVEYAVMMFAFPLFAR